MIVEELTLENDGQKKKKGINRARKIEQLSLYTRIVVVSWQVHKIKTPKGDSTNKCTAVARGSVE